MSVWSKVVVTPFQLGCPLIPKSGQEKALPVLCQVYFAEIAQFISSMSDSIQALSKNAFVGA
jgi:hypothetical protein